MSTVQRVLDVLPLVFSASLAMAADPATDGMWHGALSAGGAAAISRAWTLNLGLSSRYASSAPVGVKNTDTLLTMGLGYKY